jgi:hypothetical protein
VCGGIEAIAGGNRGWVGRRTAARVDPEVRWFTQKGKANTLYGRADRKVGVIWVRDDLDDGVLARTTAHEVRHLAPGGDEPAARAYETKFFEELYR